MSTIAKICRWRVAPLVVVTTSILLIGSSSTSRLLGHALTKSVSAALMHAAGALGEPSVWPSYGGMTAPTNTAVNDAWFEVDNTDFNPENYNLYCYVMSPVTSCSAPWSVYVDGYGSASVDVTFSTSYAGAGGVTLSVGGMVGGAEGHYDVTVQDARIAPTVAVVSGGDIRDVSRCVNSCFEKTMSYSTPSYYSLDAARSVTLVYRSGSAHPMGNVQLDVSDNSATQADLYALQLQRPDGSFVPFTNGTTVLYFQSAGHYATTHLAAAFDALSLPTGRYTYTAIVTSIWNSDGLHQQSFGTVHLIIQNESSSPFGAGWTVAGVQHAYVQSDGVLVTDGSGSATFFSGNCAPNTNCTFASPSGEFSTFKQDPSNYHRIYPDGSNLSFWFDGRDVMNSDRYGNYYFFNYGGPNGVLNMIQDPAGLNTILGFEDGSSSWKFGTLRSIQTPGGRWSWFGVNSSNDLTDFLDPDGIYFGFAQYDGSHRLNHFHDRRGGNWDFGYSLDGTVTSQLAPGITINGMTDQRPRSSQVGPSTNIINAITGTVGYQSNPVPCSIDTRARVTNPRGNASYYTLNLWGEPTQIRDPLGRTTSSSYDSNTGQLTGATGLNGHSVQYTWDGPRLTRTYDAATGQAINTSYENTYSRPTHIWGNTVERWFYYTGVRMDSSRSGTSTTPVTKYWTDTKGRIWKTSDIAGHADSTYFAVSGFQNTDSIILPGHSSSIPGRMISYRYDQYGRMRATRPLETWGDSVKYDAMNRKIATIDIASGDSTLYQYDSLYLRAVVDAKGQRFQFTRNMLGWVEQELRPGSANALITTFDSNGNVLSTRNRRLQTVTFTYDALDRVTVRSGASGNTSYGYGFSNDFASVSNAESVDTLFFDGADRLSRAKTWRGGSWYQLQNTYNPDGTRSRLDATSNMWTGTHGPQFYYTASGALQYIDDFGKRTTMTLNNESQPTSIALPNGVYNSRSWNSLHEGYESSFSSAIGDADTHLGVFTQADDAGRISARRRSAHDYDGDSLKTYGYDAKGRLSLRQIWSSSRQTCYRDPDYGYVCPMTDTIVTNEWYNYDQVGTLMNGVSQVDPGNRVRVSNGYNYNYDDDGNLISKTGPGFSQSLSWNEFGQLVSVTTNGATVTFGYDGFGRRVRKGPGNAGYLHDGQNLFMDLTSAGNIVAEYEYLPGIDKPLAVNSPVGGELLYFAIDPVSGSVRGLIRDSDKLTRAKYGYTPYGQLDSGAFDYTYLVNRLRFAAREYDAETGLYYFRARYYAPQEGRFVSEDPAGISAGMNLYAYAGDDPINNSDPSGMLATDGRGLCSIMLSSCPGDLSGLEMFELTSALISGYLNSVYGDGAGGPYPFPENGVYVGSWKIRTIAGFPLFGAHHLAIGVQDVNGPRIYELIGWIENNIVNFNRGGAFPHYGRGYGDYNWMKVADEDDIWRWERDIRWAIDDFAGCPYAAGDSNTFVGLVFSYVGFTPTSEQTAAWGWTPGNNVAAGNLPCRK